MTILTEAEAKAILRLDTATTYPALTLILPAVDEYLKSACGHDWAADSVIDATAKAAASMLLTQWFENPGMIGQVGELAFGLNNVIGQLQAKALGLARSGVPNENLAIVASMPADGSVENAVTVKPVIVFNHTMAAGVTTAFTLATAAGATVAVAAAQDVTKKIVTVTPTASLQPDTTYTLSITAAPDTYGQTLTDTIGFTTV